MGMSATILIISIILGAFGQISMKKGISDTNYIGIRAIAKNIFKVLTSPFIILGLLFYAISSLLWLSSMAKLDISFMYPLVSMGYFITAFFAAVFLKERISTTRWTGIILILAGSLFIMIGT
jgi:drug/metabolite transporter (DMT)-like permease